MRLEMQLQMEVPVARMVRVELADQAALLQEGQEARLEPQLQTLEASHMLAGLSDSIRQTEAFRAHRMQVAMPLRLEEMVRMDLLVLRVVHQLVRSQEARR